MKVPDNLIYSVFKQQDERIRNQLVKKTIEISTGKKLHNLSDDPVAAFNIISLKKDIAQLSQFSKNRLFADVNLSYIDFTLSKMSDKLKELYTKTVQAKNETLTVDDLKAIGVEFEKAVVFLLDRANDKVGENYIFSGSALTTKPFSETFTYLGSNEAFNVQIDETNFTEVFTPGNRVFTTNILELDISFASPTDPFTLGGDGQADLQITYKGVTYSITYDNNSLDATNPSNLEELSQAINITTGGKVKAFIHQLDDGTYTLRLIPEEVNQPITVSYGGVGDPSEKLGNFIQKNVFEIVSRISSKLRNGLAPDESDLLAIQRSYDKIISERSKVGSILSQVKSQQNVQENRMDVLKKQKSDIEEVNISESIMEYTRYRTAYDALMKMIVDTRDMTILKYI